MIEDFSIQFDPVDLFTSIDTNIVRHLSGSLSQSEWRPNYCNDNKERNFKPICIKDLLSWAFQVARGMEYLSQRKILYGDLARRNILLAENNIVKICDFGLAKTMYNHSNYMEKNNDPALVKWMAIESIRDRIFSTQSDIWSFGIMLWEFFTLAEIHPGMREKEQYPKSRATEWNNQITLFMKYMTLYTIYVTIAKSMLRPSFTDLVESIGNLLEESVRMVNHFFIL